MEIKSQVEKNPDNGVNRILVFIEKDDSLILEQALKAFDKYDKDDPKYVKKLAHVQFMIHDIWAQLHPS